MKKKRIGCALHYNRRKKGTFLHPQKKRKRNAPVPAQKNRPATLELTARTIPFEAEKPLNINYKGQSLTRKYFADLVCCERIIVEIKAINHLSGKEESQLLNYLKATGLRVGLLFNFGSHGKLERKRLVV